MGALAQPPPSTYGPPSPVSLVDVAPDLAECVPEDERELMRRVLVRPGYAIPKGRWAPELLRGHDNGAFAILVVGGAIIRQVDIADRCSTQLLGPGDVLQPTAD